MNINGRLVNPVLRCILPLILVFALGCAKPAVKKPAQESQVNKIYERADSLVQDKSLGVEGNPNLARALQDFYSIGGCVGVGYGDKEAAATAMAAAAYKTNMCRAGDPAKTIRFKAHNGTLYCIMSTNATAYEFQPGK